MEIKEYKLGDICVVKNGTKNKEDCSKNGKYNFYTRSKIVLKSNDWTVDGECTIIPGEGIFYPLWNNGKAAIHQRVYYIKSNELILKNKYLYYWWFKNSWILYQNAVGTTVKSLRMNNFIDPKIKLPNIQTQQAIINIIEPKEDLFLKYHKVVDITTLETFTSSWANLINIIEPFELLKQNFYNKKNKLINLINYLYKYNSQNSDKENYLLSMTNLFNKKYENQNMYIETSNINENMSITNKIKEISKNKKPSRANLSPKNNSLIFAKLRGSQKIFPIYDKKYTNYVYSTGFYNISANDLDWYLLGFLNSKDFIIQKNNNSSGTLMQGITIKDLNKIKIKIPKNKYKLNSIVKTISKINLVIEIISNLIELSVI